MGSTQKHIATIGLVLSAVPKYSETFFRNKIKGLQDSGYRVVLFVDYINANDSNFNCRVVASPNFNRGVLNILWFSFVAIIKTIFLHPKRSVILYQLNKKDGISIKDNLKQLILSQFLLAEDVDWLHYGFGMLVFDRERVAEAIGAKMAVSFRGADLYLSPLKHNNCYDLLFSKTVYYHVLSKEMKQTLIDHNISSSMIKVITPAIDTQFFKRDTKINNTSKLQLITVARLHWKKGLEYTLEALALLKQSGIDFHYTIVGEGEEKERLIFTAHQLDLLERVTFMGKLDQTEVKPLLEQATVYLQYSIQEGFCNAVLEAQALGLLCIVSNAEGLAENVLDNQTGWVVPKRSPKLLAEKIKTVIHLSNEKKEEISKKAISRVKQEFGLQKQQGEFIRFYTLN